MKAVIRRQRDANSAGGWLLLWLPGAGQARTGNRTPRHKTMPGWPSPRDGPSPHDRGRAAAGSAYQAVRCRGDARPGHDDESAGEDRPCHAHRWAGRGGAGRSSGARYGIPAEPRFAGISSDTVGAPAADAGDARPGQEASGPRPRPAADVGGAVGLAPRHVDRRGRPRRGRRAPGPARRAAKGGRSPARKVRLLPWREVTSVLNASKMTRPLVRMRPVSLRST